MPYITTRFMPERSGHATGTNYSSAILNRHECEACTAYSQQFAAWLRSNPLLRDEYVNCCECREAIFMSGVFSSDHSHLIGHRLPEVPRRARPVSADGRFACGVCIARHYTGTGVTSDGFFVRAGSGMAGQPSCPWLTDASAAFGSRLAPGVLPVDYYDDAPPTPPDDEYFDDRHDHIFRYHEVDVVGHFGWPKETPRTALAFGVELEMEHKDADDTSGQRELCKALGGRVDAKRRFILAQDGSLDSSGVELITLPYLLDYHQKQFGWAELLKPLAAIGRSGKDTTRCGMHVHCNRAALSSLQVGKVLVFINREENRMLVNSVAQRSENNYAQKFIKRVTDGRYDSGKYEAVHIAENTVEFRIFRGNLRPERVLKNIEFCHSVLLFCRDASMQNLLAPAYLEWLSKRRSTYPNLFKFLRSKERINSPDNEDI